MNVYQLRNLYLKTPRTTFCPGCGYEIFINCYLKAIDELGKTLNNYSYFVGIGCSGWIVSNYFKADNLHSAHGRAIPAAIGAKLANPGLDVIVVGGDGDIASIGGNHLKHAARRNIPIKVFCLNNYTYGMTGGQKGPTTPSGAKTSTTPKGNPERPLDLIESVFGDGGRFVSRYPTCYPHLLKKGIKSILSAKAEGFRFMEVVSQCPRHFGKQNKMSPEDMLRWQKEHYVSIERAKKMSPEQLKGKIIFGEFRGRKSFIEYLLLKEEE